MRFTELRKLSQQFRVRREAPAVSPHLSEWSQLKPLQPRSRPSQPSSSSSGASLLSRASAAVQPLRAAPSKVSTSKWSPRLSEPELLTRSLGRSRPASVPGPRGNTRSTSADILSRTIPRTSHDRHPDFLRDAAPHSKVQSVEKPVPVTSDPRAHQTQQPAVLHSRPDVHTFHDADAVSEFEEKDIAISTRLGDKGHFKRPGRKGEFKERGSLLYSSRTLPSAKHKTLNHWQQLELKKDRARNNKKIKDSQPQNVRADLYIPTVVTVGQFSRLLNVRLSAFFSYCSCLIPHTLYLGTLQRKMVQAGMRDETSYDHGSFGPLKGNYMT